MRWEETVACRCRYGDVAGRIFQNAEIIWEDSEDDYQGYATILAKMPDGTFAHYAWTYGSCSGCDEWEARNLSNAEIKAEMERGMSILADEETLKRYLHLEGEFVDATLPTTNSPTNGSIPGMLQYLGGGWGTGFESMREAAVKWLNERNEE